MGSNRNQRLVAGGLGALAVGLSAVLFAENPSRGMLIPLAFGTGAVVLAALVSRPRSWLGRQVGWVGVTALLLFMAAAAGLLTFASAEGSAVHMVVPVGFRGRVRLVVDPEQGADVFKSSGRYTYHIPADGVLRIRSAEPFSDWFSQTASYADGTRIPMEQTGLLPDDAVAWYSLDSGTRVVDGSREEFMHFLVGTHIEQRRYMNAYLGGAAARDRRSRRPR
jgi:hypothetical protein